MVMRPEKDHSEVFSIGLKGQMIATRRGKQGAMKMKRMDKWKECTFWDVTRDRFFFSCFSVSCFGRGRFYVVLEESGEDACLRLQTSCFSDLG
jgi:hypothetical protein